MRPSALTTRTTPPPVQVIETERVVEPTNDGSHDKFTHIVLEGFHKKAKDQESGDQFVPTGNSVVEGFINRVPVKALCGKEWVPDDDPKKYPICPTCKDIAKLKGWRVPA